MELDKHQYLQNFLHIVRNSKNKNDFLNNVHEFDHRFTEAYQVSTFQNKTSFQSFQSAQQLEVPQKPKNPFINQNEENIKRNYSPTRSNNFMPQTPYYNQPNMLASNQNRMNIQPSRSQQEFFKPPQAKTFHAGFNPKEYEKPNITQQLNQYSQRNPNYGWQTAQGFNQPTQYNPQSYYEQQMKQNFNQMRKNFANFSINEQKYPNDLSVNGPQNFMPLNSNIDHPNEFLAAFSREDDVIGKYYKGPIPYPNKPSEGQSSRPYMERRANPFANQ